jgi:HEPN domain-containing protein
MTPQLEEAAQLLNAAERDRTAFRILSRDAEAPNEIVLFHAQQAAEKSIKAALAAQGIVYRRTHDLVELRSLAEQNGLTIPGDHQLLVRLGPYAVELRYFGVLAPEVSRAEAEALIDVLLAWVKDRLAAGAEQPPPNPQDGSTPTD